MIEAKARLRTMLISLLVFALTACGGGGSTIPAIQSDSPQQPTPQPLRLALSTATEGNELTVLLEATQAANLYQLSCRLCYNAEAVRPVAVERGTLVEDRAVFFSRTIDEGCIPLAFTYHPGEHVPSANGTVAKLQFEIIDPQLDAALEFVNDPEFLLLRDAAGAAIDFKLGGVN